MVLKVMFVTMVLSVTSVDVSMIKSKERNKTDVHYPYHYPYLDHYPDHYPDDYPDQNHYAEHDFHDSDSSMRYHPHHHHQQVPHQCLAYLSHVMSHAVRARNTVEPMCNEIRAYINVHHGVDKYCDEEKIFKRKQLEFLHNLCFGSEGLYQTIVDIGGGPEDTGRKFWSTQCSGFTDMKAGDYIRIKMGSWVDYFKPVSYPMKFCNFIMSSSNYLWGSKAEGPYVKPLEGEVSCFGGCTVPGWPARNGGGNRSQLIIWGGDNTENRGGCCSTGPSDRAESWQKPFTMELYRNVG